MDLIADIGGTYARFATVEGGIHSTPRVFSRLDFPSFEAAIAAYLEAVGNPALRAMAVAWASLIGTGKIRLPMEHDWEFDRADLQKRFGLERLQLLNDTQAIGLALPALQAGDIYKLNQASALPDTTKVAIAIGTGFGTATVIWDRTRWLSLAGEGGHASAPFNPNPRLNAAFAYLQAKLGMVTISDVLSGNGLRNLYAAAAYIEGKDMRSVPMADEITEAASQGNDPLAQDAVHFFIEALAQIAFNLGMTALAAGGIYFAGGMAPRLISFIEGNEAFAALFQRNPFALSIVTREYPALLGLQQIL